MQACTPARRRVHTDTLLFRRNLPSVRGPSLRSYMDSDAAAKMCVHVGLPRLINPMSRQTPYQVTSGSQEWKWHSQGQHHSRWCKPTGASPQTQKCVWNSPAVTEGRQARAWMRGLRQAQRQARIRSRAAYASCAPISSCSQALAAVALPNVWLTNIQPLSCCSTTSARCCDVYPTPLSPLPKVPPEMLAVTLLGSACSPSIQLRVSLIKAAGHGHGAHTHL